MIRPAVIETMTDFEALKLATQFAIKPAACGKCGDKDSPDEIKQAILTCDSQRLENELPKFNTLYPYLKTIAQICGQPIDSYQVAESYWLGNDLLKQARPKHYDLLINNFVEQKAPDNLISMMKQNPPKVFIPFHLFYVLHNGVGRPDDMGEFTLQAANNCMVRWGRVEKITGQTVRVELQSLYGRGGKLPIQSLVEQLPFDPDIIPGLKSGDFVAAHWGSVAKIITKEEERNLSYWTYQVLDNI